MQPLLEQLSICIERGKVNQQASYPPEMAGQKGADELTLEALQEGIAPSEILETALIKAMQNIGEKFSNGQAYIPDLLIASKAMKAAMEHLKPYFESGTVQTKGTFILATVQGDMHDIGKNLVKMVLEGAGWEIIDLGTNVTADKVLEALNKNPESYVGLSALLTTTMLNMEAIVKAAKDNFPKVKIFIGGAPVTQRFSESIGADGYFRDPRALINHLSTLR